MNDWIQQPKSSAISYACMHNKFFHHNQGIILIWLWAITHNPP